ncbi:MAG: hypothetical protein M3162_08440, partial [Thermoproteota archaeon]|nr:hypothetical protein [Thermoproteota archaeon]
GSFMSGMGGLFYMIMFVVGLLAIRNRKTRSEGFIKYLLFSIIMAVFTIVVASNIFGIMSLLRL